MSSYSKVREKIKTVRTSKLPKKEDLEFLLSLEVPEEIELLRVEADRVRQKTVGDGILLRGIIEFSNVCNNTCLYCGLNRNNIKLKRYGLTIQEVIERTDKISSAGIKTVVLQSGQDNNVDVGWLAEIIREIKIRHKMAVTISSGEKNFSDYNKWRKSGADRYLLKIETSNEKLYTSLHPGMDFKERVRCYDYLKDLGYQTGSGCLVGIKGQMGSHLAEDMIFFKKNKFDMIGVGVFIPHEETLLAGEPAGSSKLSIKVLSLTRILNPYCHLPAATSLGTMERDLRRRAFVSGANVFMPNFTPEKVSRLYEIYPGKKDACCSSGEEMTGIEKETEEMGRYLDYSVGDSILARDRET